MRKIHSAAFALSALSLMTSCIIGRVLYTDGTPFVGAFVTIRQCDTCQPVLVLTDTNGYFAYDPYSLPQFPDVPFFDDQDDGIIVTIFEHEWDTTSGGTKTCFRTGEIQIAHRPNFITVVNPSGDQVDFTLLPNTFVDRVSTNVGAAVPCSDLVPQLDLGLLQLFRDPDFDGLPDAVEAIYGTNRLSSDTDGDGLSDSLELYGMHSAGNAANRTWTVGTDIRSRGASPRRKDAFIEVTHELLLDPAGLWRSMRPSEILRTAITDFYDGLTRINNPDGTTGMNVVVVPDTFGVDLSGKNCQTEAFTNIANYISPRRLGVFTHALYCNTQSTPPFGFFGGALPRDPRFWVRANFPSPDIDDLDDLNVHDLYARTLHEFGHTLNLMHGGDVSANGKPNYPSVVNNIYTDFFISGNTLRTTQLQHSPGDLTALNETALSEIDPFSRTEAELAFIRFETRTGANGNGDVNWDGGGYSTTTVERHTRNVFCSIPSCQLPGTLQEDMRDFDDILEIVSSLPTHLEAATESASASTEAGSELACQFNDGTDPPPSSAITVGRDPFGGDLGAALQRVTGQDASSLTKSFAALGIDPLEDAETLARAAQFRIGQSQDWMLGLLQSDGLPSTLHAESSEAELVEVIEDHLKQASGRDIQVRFADCTLSPESLKERLELTKVSHSKSVTTPQIQSSPEALLEGKNEVTLCR